MHVTFEEGTSAAWLYDLLKPHVTRVVVCDPRKNKSMREGNQSDKIDARRLAELLRLNHLNPVYYKEFVCSYLTVTKDLARVMAMIRTISLRSPEESWPLGLPGNQPKRGRKPLTAAGCICMPKNWLRR